MKVRVVSANENLARFYDIARLSEPLHRVRELEDPTARLHDRDLKSDRPGIVYAQAPSATKRRGGVRHAGTGGERRPRQHAAAVFAGRVVKELEQNYRAGEFTRLVIVAGPGFLGRLRSALPRILKQRVVAEVPKDLLKRTEVSIRRHLPIEVFYP